MLVVPEVPAVLTDPGMYSVKAEKSSPFNGKLRIAFAVIVLPSVALLVFRIGAAAETFTVVEPPPGESSTLKLIVCNAPR